MQFNFWSCRQGCSKSCLDGSLLLWHIQSAHSSLGPSPEACASSSFCQIANPHLQELKAFQQNFCLCLCWHVSTWGHMCGFRLPAELCTARACQQLAEPASPLKNPIIDPIFVVLDPAFHQVQFSNCLSECAPMGQTMPCNACAPVLQSQC